MKQDTKVEPTGRYSIGEQLIVISVVTAHPGTNDNPPSKTAQTMLPYKHQRERGVKVTNFHLNVLTVTEHHKVPSEYSENDQRDCDGYVLTDEDGNIWRNQYPRASYGQVSDNGDRLFFRHFPERTDYNSVIYDWRNPWQAILFDQFIDDYTIKPWHSEKILNSLNSDDPIIHPADLAYIQEQCLLAMAKFRALYDKRFKIDRVVIASGTSFTGKPYEISRQKVIPI